VGDMGEGLERLSIKHVTGPYLEQQVAELGIAIVTTRRGRTGDRRWFQCPGKDCGRRCSTLYLSEEGLVCAGCARLSDEKPQQQPRAPLRQQPTQRDKRSLQIERNQVPPAQPRATAKMQHVATATRTDQPPRQLVDEFRRITVQRVLARFGLPVSLGDGSGLHVCSVSEIRRFIMLPTAQRLGGVRWWFRCDACQQRCGFLYSPRSARVWDLRCRKCWNLTYRSQRK
jgi:hypothetical protein